MGMDTIEILMKVEDTFDIKIPDREAEKILTVGDFHDVVWRQLYSKSGERCKSQSLFYKLRQSVAQSFNFPAQQLQLGTSPNEVFPWQNRRQTYFAFAQSNNLKLPNLILASPLATLLDTFGYITILGGLAASITLINFFDYSKWTLLMPVLGIALTMLLSNLFEPRRTVIEAPNIRSFTEQTLALNYATIMTEQGTNRPEMEIVINHIIAHMAGLDIRKIKPEKKISDDLGID